MTSKGHPPGDEFVDAVLGVADDPLVQPDCADFSLGGIGAGGVPGLAVGADEGVDLTEANQLVGWGGGGLRLPGVGGF